MPPRVLVAEDEHLIAVSLSHHLSKFGCTVIGPASNGNTAIELARSDQPDLAILDIQMPNRTGLEVAHELWNELQIPSMILTAYSDESNVRASADTGVFGYMLKPVEPVGLRASLAVAWARASEVLESRQRIAQLERSLEHRATIEKAKWRLVEAKGITETEAHRVLQTTARNKRARLVDIAAEILQGDSNFGD